MQWCEGDTHSDVVMEPEKPINKSSKDAPIGWLSAVDLTPPPAQATTSACTLPAQKNVIPPSVPFPPFILVTHSNPCPPHVMSRSARLVYPGSNHLLTLHTGSGLGRGPSCPSHRFSQHMRRQGPAPATLHCDRLSWRN